MGFAINAANLLEVGELRHLHAVEPDFPSQTPGAQRWVLPIVFHEADVVLFRSKPISASTGPDTTPECWLVPASTPLDTGNSAANDSGFTVTTIFGAATRLHISGFPGSGPNAQEGSGVAGAGTHFHVIGLQQRAPWSIPVTLQTQDELLESQHVVAFVCARADCLPTQNTDSIKWDRHQQRKCDQGHKPKRPPPGIGCHPEKPYRPTNTPR